MTSTRVLVLAAAACLLSDLGEAQGAAYIPIPGGGNCADVTPDGKIVVGDGPVGGAFYWRWQTDPAPTFIGGLSGTGISDDGSVITGNMSDPGTGAQVAGVWTQATGWVPLGGINGSCGSISSGYDVSADGTKIVGLGWDGCSAHGFYWTETGGMQALELLAFGTNRASVIAGDGSVIGGFAQGSQNRTPATWLPDLSGQVFQVDAIGEIHGVNGDGTTFFGEWNDSAFYTEGETIVPLGNLNGLGWTGIATGGSESLGRIVGFDISGLSREAWTWTPADGMVSLHTTLSNLGVQGLPGGLFALRRSSADGTVLVGNNTFQGWIVTLPPFTGWNQYGVGAAAANNLDLDGSGDATVGGTFFATTSGVVGSATATFISLDGGNLPLLGGRFLLDALKLVNPVLVEATAAGSSTNTIPIPNDPALAGVSVFFQSLAEDGGQPLGFAFSNGLELTLGA